MSNVQVIKTSSGDAVSQAQIEEFEARLHGALIRPGDDAYDEARSVWNGMIDRHPALIARPVDVEDVVASINFARENSILLAVRGGGHNVAGLGTSDGGLVIDLSLMNDVQVDPGARTARVGGGATIGDVDQATQKYGLATPLGVVTATGIAGLTLGGGYGYLRNKYGLSCDNVISAQVVTADGHVITASQQENTDLFWGIRGGGGNFGIVTEFMYRLYPIGPDVAFTFVLHDGEGDNMKKAIQFYRDYVTTAPDEVSSLAATGIVPPHPEAFPENIHGRPFVLFLAMYAGPAEEGQRVMQPLRDLGEPLIDFSAIMPYLEAQSSLDEDYPDGMRYYWKSLNLTRLDDDVIDRIVKHAQQQPSVLSTVDLWHVGGAVTRVSAEESAFNGRQAAFLINPEANWVDAEDDEANITWVREFIAAMQEFSDGSRYLNFPGFQEEGDEMMRKAFGPQYERLATLKNKYDPNNLFSLNQNIKPRI